MDPDASLQAQQMGAAIFVVFMVLVAVVMLTVPHLRAVIGSRFGSSVPWV